MNYRAITALARKDIQLALQNKGVLIPVIVVPVVMLLILPALLILLPTQMATPEEMLDEMAAFFSNMPMSLTDSIAGLDPIQVWVHFATIYMFAPFFLLVPIMVSSVVGADSFVGERERKTLEALLYSPISDTELFVAKVLAAFAPAVAISWLSFVLYSVVVNALGAGVMGGLFFPTWMWVVLVLWVVPAAAGLGLGSMVLVSSKAKTFQEAYQLGSMIVIPVLFLVFGQFAGVLYFSLPVVFLIGLVLWLADAALIFVGVKTFSRGELVARV